MSVPRLVLDALREEDAGELVRLARLWGQPLFHVSAGAHGAVVRDGASVVAFTFLRETSYGLVVDELWNEPASMGRRGLAGLGMLTEWLETVAAKTARERGTPVTLGGIVRCDNPSHEAALAHRGYEIVAHVRAKEFAP
jgi:hypothetical protein